MANALRIVDNETPMQNNKKAAAEMASYFAIQCGMRKLPWMAAEFEKLINKGFEVELLQEIVDRTARAPRPSWAYLNAIIGKCLYYAAYDMATFLLLPRKGAYEDGLPY